MEIKFGDKKRDRFRSSSSAFSIQLFWRSFLANQTEGFRFVRELVPELQTVKQQPQKSQESAKTFAKTFAQILAFGD
jgi:hypothetical protein